MQDTPKVLIIGQPFNKTSGGGITITNLFHNWPQDRFSVATIPNKLRKNNFDICSNVYCLGYDELKIRFPFSLLLKNKKSGLYHKHETGKIYKNNKSESIPFYNLIYRILLRLTFIFDLNYLFYRIHTSRKFLSYVEEFQPDVIYTQLGHLEFVGFLNELYKYINIPLVIHIMDDWPYHSAQGIFKAFWQKKLDEGFRNLLRRASALLSISEAMSAEYQIRYGKKFIPFHNPINTTVKKITRVPISTKKKFAICYAGRIGFSNINGIKDMSIAVDKLRKNKYQVTFKIYSPDADKALSSSLSKYEGIEIEQPVAHAKIISLLQSHDLLFLPLDYDANSIGYAKLSMPTKATEYMISSTPILLYAPKEMGISISAQNEKWAHVVNERSVDKLSDAIIQILSAESYYNMLSDNAYKYAKMNYDANIIRNNFREILIKCNAPEAVK